jgi:hypothetical protein
VRGIATVLATVVGLAVIVFGFIVWDASPHSPDFLPESAGALIAGRFADESIRMGSSGFHSSTSIPNICCVLMSNST